MPRITLAPWVAEATVITPVSVGPRHGVQPSANTAPSSGAPATVDSWRGVKRACRCRAGTKPTNTRPITMVTTPPTRCSSSWLLIRVVVMPSTATVPRTNTAVNPATNSAAEPATRQRAAGGALTAPSCSSTPTTAARYDRYPGTSGTTHGEANDTSPASTHTASANNSGPAAAMCANPVIAVPAWFGVRPPRAVPRAAGPRPTVPAGIPRPLDAGGRVSASTG